ncbi:hypothetical protein NHX12_002077 [Muraenolepis orangiensis]|uniref:Ig-like domain-containing protein n=1 Tax=Muraenolepis orangiensis TaxID=630683 RepID=A0A9Q0E254_9TELE|nr:hypothetical protein NHX12_002077 [Muraenolepis orangiensis]
MLVQVGTGQVLHRPSLEASQRGRYLCQARNPLGEHNASALLQMEETTLGKTFVFGLSGGGVTVFATLGIVLAHDSQEGEIAYSTIGNFRETRPVKHRDSNVNLKEQPFESPEAGEAGGQHVTYSTV